MKGKGFNSTKLFVILLLTQKSENMSPKIIRERGCMITKLGAPTC